MTKLQPITIGWYLFRGLRHSTRPGAISHIHEPVKIVEMSFPRKPGLGVSHAGTDVLYDLARYDGEWTVLDMEKVAA